MLSGIDGVLLIVVIGEGKLVVPVDFVIRWPDPPVSFLFLSPLVFNRVSLHIYLDSGRLCSYEKSSPFFYFMVFYLFL